MKMSNKKSIFKKTAIYSALSLLIASGNALSAQQGDVLLYKGNKFIYDWKSWVNEVNAYLNGRSFSDLTSTEQQELLNLITNPPASVPTVDNKVIANNDSFSVGKDSSNNPLLVLRNDTNATDVASIDGVTGGTATVSNGAILFTPDSGFTGKAEIVYTATNGQASAQAVATIDVQDSASGWVAWLNNNCTNSTNTDITDLNNISTVDFTCTVNEAPPPATAFTVNKMKLTFPAGSFTQSAVDSFSNLTVSSSFGVSRGDKTEIAELSFIKPFKDAISSPNSLNFYTDGSSLIATVYSSKNVYFRNSNIKLAKSYAENPKMYQVGLNRFYTHILDLPAFKIANNENLEATGGVHYYLISFDPNDITTLINSQVNYKTTNLYVRPASTQTTLPDVPHLTYNNGLPYNSYDHYLGIYLGYDKLSFSSIDFLKTMDVSTTQKTSLRYGFKEVGLSNLTENQKLDFNSNYINAIFTNPNFYGVITITGTDGRARNVVSGKSLYIRDIASSIFKTGAFNGADLSGGDRIYLYDDAPAQSILGGVNKAHIIQTDSSANISDLTFLSNLDEVYDLYFWNKMPASLSGLKNGLIVKNLLYLYSQNYDSWDGKLSDLDKVYAKSIYLGNAGSKMTSSNDGLTNNGVIAQAMRGEIAWPISNLTLYVKDPSTGRHEYAISLSASSAYNIFRIGFPGSEKYFAPGFLAGDYKNTDVHIYGMTPEIKACFNGNTSVKNVIIETTNDIDLSFLDNVANFNSVTFPSGVTYTSKATNGTGFCLSWKNGARVKLSDGTPLDYASYGADYCQ